MIYRVEHRTRYAYGSTVPVARCLLRLVPRDRLGQTVATRRLDITPAPSRQGAETDFFGNIVTRVEFADAHTDLELTSVALIRVERDEPPMPALTMAWESVGEAAEQCADLGPDAPAHFLHASPHVPISPAATAYAAQCFAPQRTILTAGLALAERIKADFAYDPEATDVSTPVAEVLRARRGVCQDFAHLMIAGLRGLGLPARYVSGYLRTVPPPGQERLTGADATHAWVDLWCGPADGWIGLDPTNGIAAGNDHLVLAVGRDYADVAPVSGVILASGHHTLDVSVDVAPLGEREALAVTGT